MIDALAHAKEVRQRIIAAGERAEAQRRKDSREASARAANAAYYAALARRRAEVPQLPPEAHAAVVAVLTLHNLTWNDIISHARDARLHPPRRQIYLILRDLGWSYPRIARCCNRACHTSIMHGILMIKYNTGKRRSVRSSQ